MKVGDKKLIPDYDPDELNTVIKTQRKIIDYMKDRKLNKLYSCLIVIDDQADDPRFVRHSKLLHCFSYKRKASWYFTNLFKTI